MFQFREGAWKGVIDNQQSAACKWLDSDASVAPDTIVTVMHAQEMVQK